ncbi:transmembrane protein 171 [Ochotona princeps]|uniref:transmembrane protein 171 n=1 Tax=Ochotona princeps TaxID=9978 RepID=UPI0027146411|nr:transmembrane protein 171 [Ochotona princeps]XP_058512344.1 transmembrane protein 171 [Ochotona princeps]XP_058512345.1 transmembrane protein 171 [Ochotona princeps]
MSPTATSETEQDEEQRNRFISRLIFFLFIFGAVLLCVGVLLSIFGFQACQDESATDCSLVLKIAGPSCAVIGLGVVILARSRARLQMLEVRRRGNQADPDQAFLCGESRQFVQCLIFGFLFLTSGMLISVLGIWVPGCDSNWVQDSLNMTNSPRPEPQICGFLSLQIMGPLIVLVGLCFFVIAHVKKRNTLNATHEVSESEEGPSQSMEPVQVTVGDSVIIFPPPPPPYFPEASASPVSPVHGTDGALPHENPPPYHSIFNQGTPAPESQGEASGRDCESIFTISGTDASSELSRAPYLSYELPPRYEEKDSAAPASQPPAP